MRVFGKRKNFQLFVYRIDSHDEKIRRHRKDENTFSLPIEESRYFQDSENLYQKRVCGATTQK